MWIRHFHGFSNVLTRRSSIACRCSHTSRTRALQRSIAGNTRWAGPQVVTARVILHIDLLRGLLHWLAQLIRGRCVCRLAHTTRTH